MSTKLHPTTETPGVADISDRPFPTGPTRKRARPKHGLLAENTRSALDLVVVHGLKVNKNKQTKKLSQQKSKEESLKSFNLNFTIRLFH